MKGDASSSFVNMREHASRRRPLARVGPTLHAPSLPPSPVRALAKSSGPSGSDSPKVAASSSAELLYASWEQCA